MSFENIIPFILVFVIILIIVLLQKQKSASQKEQYDERQELFRKNAYKYSAMTMLLCALIYFIITSMSEHSFAEDGVSALLIALVGIAVFVGYSIFKDAFFGVRGQRGNFSRPAYYIILLVVIALVNVIGSVRMFQEHMLIRNGQLTSSVMQPALALLFILILVCIGIKYLKDNRDAREIDG